MNKRFNVLQCLSQPTWHFDAYNNKCSLVAKKSQVSLYHPFVFSHIWKWVGNGTKLQIYFHLFFLQLLRHGFHWRTARRENPPKNPDLFSAADAKSRLLTVIWLCGKPPWFPFLQAHALIIKCPCPCFKENKKRSKVRKKNDWCFLQWM